MNQVKKNELSEEELDAIFKELDELIEELVKQIEEEDEKSVAK